MMGALGADAQAGGKVLVVDDLRARRTLDPEPLRNAALVGGRLDRLTWFLEPGHSTEDTSVNSQLPTTNPRPEPVRLSARNTACLFPSSGSDARDPPPRRPPMRDRSGMFRPREAASCCSGRRSGCRPRSIP